VRHWPPITDHWLPCAGGWPLVIALMSPPGARRKKVSFGVKKCKKVQKGEIWTALTIPYLLDRNYQLSTNRCLRLKTAGLAGF